MASKRTTLTVEQRQTVDAMLKRFTSICMFEVKAGKLWLLKEHWKYIDYKRDAVRVLVCKGVKTKEGYYYSVDLV
jgi:hypothetical protein